MNLCRVVGRQWWWMAYNCGRTRRGAVQVWLVPFLMSARAPDRPDGHGARPASHCVLLVAVGDRC